MGRRAVVLDIGGVLEFTPALTIGGKWEAEFGLPPGSFADLGDVWTAGSIGAITEDEVSRQIGERLGLVPDQVEAYMADLWRQYVGTLNVELAEYFRSLRRKYRTAILSNSFVGAREREEELYHFSEMSEFIVYSHEVGLSKPDPRIYELTCARLELPPEQVVFVDDTEKCVDGARAVGIHAIQFTDTAQTIAEIQAALEDDGCL